MRENFDRDETVQIKEKVIQVRRVTKVVKGGKRLGFRVCVVVGNGLGQVSVGVGKAAEVPDAVKKGIAKAKKEFLNVPLAGTTIPHQTWGQAGSSKVLVKPAPAGTGVIAGGPVRIVLELAGIKDAVAKAFGAANVINTARATLDALGNLKNFKEESKARNKPVFSKWTKMAESKNDFGADTLEISDSVRGEIGEEVRPDENK